MKNVLQGIEPQKAMYYFEKISSIQRGSSYEKPMSDYLVQFAKERGFEVWQDKVYNICMRAPGTAGGENAKPVILHGHMDMVWNVADGVKHDFLNEELDLYIDEGWIKARGTTLGADNGIGVAYMLALLDSKDIPHPPLECVITVMEEMGKKGADVYDLSHLTGKRMIDFNWIDDKQLLVGCAGDLSIKITAPCQWEAAPAGMTPMTLSLSGLKGGHCEWDIHCERGNSIQLMARALGELASTADYRLASFNGGVQNNVIPAVADATILVAPKDQEAVTKFVKTLEATYKSEFDVADPDIVFTVAAGGAYPEKVFAQSAAKSVVGMVFVLPNSVITKNLKNPGYTECSLNLGILRTEGEEVWMITTITSAVTSRKHAVRDQIFTIVDFAGNGIKAEQFGVDAPEFAYNPNSEMARIAEKAYQESWGFLPKRENNFCSLQLGLFTMAKGLDCVGVGTLINDVHCAKERMNIESIQKVWPMITNFMQHLCVE
jgi:dipeptidase D